MTDVRGFALHPGAADDIAEIWQFIANDNPAPASNFREEILEAIRKLVKFPRTGHKRSDLSARPLRFQAVRDYLIVYAPDEKPLIVLAVIHGRRNPLIVAAALRARK